MSLDLSKIREQFPALSRPVVYFDNPGGTQIARQSLERITAYLTGSNANHGGHFATSHDSDAMIEQAREAAADFLNASRPEEIVLGPNMTSLTFRLGRALAPTFKRGETIVCTRLDHDANVTPWTRLAEDRKLKVRMVDFDVETGLLDIEQMRKVIAEEKPRLVAVGYASNALGTVNPVAQVVEAAHAVGALVYVDAVQYAPHGPIDVQTLGCDFLVCSAYKFFGPHVGVLYGRYDLLDEIRAYRVRPASAEAPEKFETGTNNFEGIAGVLGALEYLEWVGKTFGGEHIEMYGENYSGRKLVFKTAMAAIRSYETELSSALLRTLEPIPGLRLYGPCDPRHFEQRVPTFSFTLEGHSAEEVAKYLGDHDIFVWDGNFYAINVTERLGLEHDGGGLVRVGAVHYNTVEEVAKLGEVLKNFAK
jgi:cysteine desulfurase family protein (TIGR01976 family)